MPIGDFAVNLKNFFSKIHFQRIEHMVGDMSLFHQACHVFADDFVNQLWHSLSFGIKKL